MGRNSTQVDFRTQAMMVYNHAKRYPSVCKKMYMRKLICKSSEKTRSFMRVNYDDETGSQTNLFINYEEKQDCTVNDKRQHRIRKLLCRLAILGQGIHFTNHEDMMMMYLNPAIHESAKCKLIIQNKC
ncbi:unnamed protein product [Orchesella dallaii]|uniref:Uncharacterized protein n=1 Tax=Orchesella dallaii TaxID=48710 RepID=A0ABP1R7G7_9HEXA